MSLARADLESLLRNRRLDRTLTSALPPVVRPGDQGDPGGGHGHDIDHDVAPSGVATLDTRLAGGFPRGHLSELVGPRSSGRTSLLLQMLAVATARGERVALIDALDMLDVASAEAAGVDLTHLLWVRGFVVLNPGLCRDLNARALDQSVKALTLVLQSGLFGFVAFDLADAPPDAARRLPFTTWLRLQRIVEGTKTACVLVGSDRMARSSAGLTVKLGIGDQGLGIKEAGVGARAMFHGRLFNGLTVEARVVCARAHVHREVPRELRRELRKDTTVTLGTVASHGV